VNEYMQRMAENDPELVSVRCSQCGDQIVAMSWEADAEWWCGTCAEFPMAVQVEYEEKD